MLLKAMYVKGFKFMTTLVPMFKKIEQTKIKQSMMIFVPAQKQK